jgi:methylenetetrahydrofolate--tRNA-(uracil-5-)-methyltransferase
MDRLLHGQEPLLPPPTTMLGALMHYLRTAEPGRFQPMNSNFGLLAPLTEHVRDKSLRRKRMVQRARTDCASWLEAGIAHSASTT